MAWILFKFLTFLWKLCRLWQSLFSLNLKDVVKLGNSCSEVFLQFLAFLWELCRLWQSLFGLNLKNAVKLGSSCSEVFLQVFSFFMETLPFVAKFVWLKS